MPFYVPIVQPEGKFIDVPAKVLLAGMVIDAMNAALQDRPHALNAIRADCTSDVFLGAVIDCFMAKEQPAQGVIACVFIGVNLRPWLNVGVDHFVNGRPVRVVNRHGDGMAATFPDAQDGRLSDRSAPLPELLVFVLIGFLAADVRLINFHDAAQHFEFVPAGHPEPLQQEPGAFLSDTDLFGQLQRGNAFAGRDEQVHGIEPLVERNVGPLEDGSGSYRKVLLAGVAAVKTALSGRDPLLAFAGRTGDAVLPQARLQIGPSRLLVGEHLEEFKRADRDFVHGQAPYLGAILAETVKGVKYIIPKKKGS